MDIRVFLLVNKVTPFYETRQSFDGLTRQAALMNEVPGYVLRIIIIFRYVPVKY